ARLAINVDDLSDEIVNFILQTISAHGINHLRLDVSEVNAADPVAVLQGLASVVRSLHINQKRAHDVD
ncbi:hypothetical protein PMAYCL1PPCAC_20541, partial [Pristionchus mayeri]